MAITSNTTANNLDAGDVDRERTVTLDAGSNSIETGGAVKFDGSGNITMTTAHSDDAIGIVRPEAQISDSKYAVEVFGHVAAVQLDDDGTTSVTEGDTLIPSASYDGAWTDGDGSGMVANTGDTDQPLYMNHPFALESGAGATANGSIDGDVILACFR
jgi:hypothetical protein